MLKFARCSNAISRFVDTAFMREHDIDFILGDTFVPNILEVHPKEIEEVFLLLEFSDKRR